MIRRNVVLKQRKEEKNENIHLRFHKKCGQILLCEYDEYDYSQFYVYLDKLGMVGNASEGCASL